MKISTALSLFLLAGCAWNDAARTPDVALAKPGTPVQTAERRRLLTGCWVGAAQIEGGGQRVWLVQRGDDGRFRIDFRTEVDNADAETTTEVGSWGVSGEIYFTITRGWLTPNGPQAADMGDPYFYDAYLIEALDDQQFVYRHAETGYAYRVTRPVGDCALPDTAA